MQVDRRSFVRRTAWAGVSALGFLSERHSNRLQAAPPAAEAPLRVCVWCEGTAKKSVYPDDIDGALAKYLGRRDGVNVVRARLGDPGSGLDDKTLDNTDVLVWWGRLRHDDVPRDRVEAIVRRVTAGQLGFVALHAACASKPFRELMGTSCEPGRWREDGQPEHISIKTPDHPIAQGIAPFTLAKTDMFAEPFKVPTPETVVLVSTWDQGETMRSGLTWTIDKGRVVYLRPGHDASPVLVHPSIRKVIGNAVLWAGHRA